MNNVGYSRLTNEMPTVDEFGAAFSEGLLKISRVRSTSRSGFVFGIADMRVNFCA